MASIQRAAFLAILLWLALPAAANAGGVVTNCSNDAQFSTLLASGGTVTFNCGGTGAAALITLSSTKTIGNGVDVTIEGGGNITLSGGGVRQLFYVSTRGSLTLNNLALTNGSSFGGGAIRNDGALFIVGSTVSGNTATSTSFGGAVRNDGSLTIADSVFADNTAPGGYGGAIDTGATNSVVNVTRSQFRGNSAALGGGAIASNGTVTIIDSTFQNNSTASSGGTSGGGAIETTNSLTVQRSTFTGNSAGKGGAIYNEGGTTRIFNSTLSANRADVAPRTGGGIHNQSGSVSGLVTIVSSTLADNVATSGSGGNIFSAAGNTVRLKQAILAGGVPANCAGTISTLGNNLDTGTSCGLGNSELGNTPAGLLPLADNGGSTQTHALTPGSAARDAIAPEACTDEAGTLITSDQRNIARPQNTRCDVGAFEYVSGIATPVADLGLTNSDNQDPVLVGAPFTYTIVATNLGPSAATGVRVTDTLPAGISLLSVATTTGTCNGATTIVCQIGTLANGAQATVTLGVKSLSADQVTNTAAVSANEPDPVPSNNGASQATLAVEAVELAHALFLPLLRHE